MTTSYRKMQGWAIEVESGFAVLKHATSHDGKLPVALIIGSGDNHPVIYTEEEHQAKMAEVLREVLNAVLDDMTINEMTAALVDTHVKLVAVRHNIKL